MGQVLQFEKVSVTDAKKVLDSILPTTGQRRHETDWRWARRYLPLPTLNEATVAWMGRLPPKIRPLELSRAFPRIANRLCSVWNRKKECDRYFDDLTIDQRGHRKGFPPAVAQEIAALKQHYAGPTLQNWQWNSSVYRR